MAEAASVAAEREAATVVEMEAEEEACTDVNVHAIIGESPQQALTSEASRAGSHVQHS